MSRQPEIRTERLLLRRWRETDLDPFAELNADPVVMEHYVAPLSRAATVAYVERIEREFDDVGYGSWSVEVRGVAAFVGVVGLHRVSWDAPFGAAVEIGWRLAKEHWHHGYATEAARAALGFGFREAGLTAILAFTSRNNLPSRRVMERIGLVHDIRADFDHPGVPAGHRLRRHVLYRSPPELIASIRQGWAGSP